MSQGLRGWCDEAWTAVAQLPAIIGTELRTRWDGHAAHDQVVVTLFGPYDSGKTSLLKRVLVDAGHLVPDWVTVSGRRETFEPREVSVARVLVRDTPGIAGGNERHDALAKDALLLSDVIVVVLPPQLMTSDRDAILDVLTGRRFGCAACWAFPDGGLQVVLSRMDEAGAMPRDDVQGYLELVERKRAELAALLSAEGGAAETAPVLAVAADPFGLVGNAQPSGPGEYDADRAWDGVAGFTAFLQRLADQKALLRQHSEVRFLGAELTSLHVSLEALSVENHIAAEAATNEARAHGLALERLGALLGAARADLDRRIADEVSAATRRGAADVKELREVVLARLDEALERWAKEHDAALEILTREADTELEVRRTRPAWKKLADVLGDFATPPLPGPNSKAAREVVGKVHRLAKTTHKAFREAQPLLIGMPLEKARQELQKLRQAPSFAEYARQATKGATRFKDADNAAQARRAVLADAGIEVALSAIAELGGLLIEGWYENKAADQRAARRAEVRRVIEASTGQLADRAWSLWREEGMPSALESALTMAKDSAQAVATSLRSEGICITKVRDKLGGLLEAIEGPV